MSNEDKNKKVTERKESEDYGAFQVEEREALVDTFEVDDIDGDGGVGAPDIKK